MKVYVCAILNTITKKKFVWSFASKDPVNDIEVKIIVIALGWDLKECKYSYQLKTKQSEGKALEWEKK